MKRINYIDSIVKRCRKCEKILIPYENCYPSSFNRKNYICSECLTNYYKIHNQIKEVKERANKRCAKYGKTLKGKKTRKKYKQSIKGKISNKRYRNSEKGKESFKIWLNTKNGYEKRRMNEDKRKRSLQYIPLNIPFKNSNGHHVDNKYIIYIPKKWHNEIRHRLNNPLSMIPINALAFFFLMQQNIKELGDLFVI